MARTLTVYLAADTSKFRSNMKSAADAVDGPQGFHGKLNALSGKLSGAFAGAVAGAAGVVGGLALAMGVDGVKAAMDAEAKFDSFNKVMTNMGWGDQAPKAKEFVDQLARITLFEDDALLKPLQDLAVAIGGPDGLNQAMGVLPGLLDAAQGSGKPLETIITGVGKAVNGQALALKRLFPWLDDTTAKSGDLKKIVGELEGKFQGAAEGATKTFEGQVKNTAKAFDELKEAFGQGFLDGLTNAKGGMGDFADTLYKRQTDVKDFGKELGTNLTTLVGIAGAAGDAKQSFEDWTGGLGEWGKLLNVFVSTALNPVMSGLQTILSTIDRVKAALESLNKVPATATSGDASLLVAQKQAAQGSHVNAGLRDVTDKTPATVININTGIGDPVRIAKEVQSVIALAASRTGR